MKPQKFQKNKRKNHPVKTNLKAGEAGECACPMIYDPVCGARTYSNECLAECSGAEIVFPGPCKY